MTDLRQALEKCVDVIRRSDAEFCGAHSREPVSGEEWDQALEAAEDALDDELASRIVDRLAPSPEEGEKVIDELISYADHTQGCMVAAGHDTCTCGYDDAEAKAIAVYDALKAENARLAAALREASASPAPALYELATPGTKPRAKRTTREGTRCVKPINVQARLGYSSVTVWRMERDGRLPARDVFVGGKAVGWRPETLESAERGDTSVA